ncbi:MAG: sugar transferase [Capsulimonadales bacterium]|nr:sugar transferase [Capsulimonadales bacterium]
MQTQQALIIGTHCAAIRLALDLQEHPEIGILPVAFVREDSSEIAFPPPDGPVPPVLGSLRDLPSLIQTRRVSVLFLTGDRESTEEFVRDAVTATGTTVQIYRLRAFYEQVLKKIPSVCIDETWFVSERGFRLRTNPTDVAAKRVTDIAFGGLLAVSLSPVMLLAALAVRLDSPGPILYSQIRTGKDGKPFRVFKFRSMYRDAEKQGARWASEQDPRITRVGRFLRTSRVDELPQLWNVLRGEMSLIGPRPERPEFDRLLSEQIPHYEARYAIKPGLSGWAQVMYPYGASVDDAREKLAYDLYYIKNCSAFLDLLITWKTVLVVLFRKGR